MKLRNPAPKAKNTFKSVPIIISLLKFSTSIVSKSDAVITPNNDCESFVTINKSGIGAKQKNQGLAETRAK